MTAPACHLIPMWISELSKYADRLWCTTHSRYDCPQDEGDGVSP